KGAFTGANETRPGRFELADHGTLFLDEIGDVPLEVQVRLLRVLQSREFERVGGTRTLFSDFRLVAATHQNLAQLVSDNTFREDLFYRLNIFPIQVPPLRERREDIPQLTIYFLEKFCKKLGKPVLKIRQSEMNTLCDYNWPGNVRELEHIIERGTIMSSGPVMRLPELQHFQYSSENQDVSTIRSLEDNERDHILRTLEMTRWKVSGPNGAAKILGVNPNTLTSKMSKLRIHRNSI
ncbi:sigma 54-interacting transcriptional regulator, partial [bacterium]|nr:sigma 54-interacting transcriptional regulator [bacterium]